MFEILITLDWPALRAWLALMTTSLNIDRAEPLPA
jgi:hypothetical protein